MRRIKIEVANIYCKDTENFFSSDTVYLLHNLRVANSGIAILEDPVPRSAIAYITEDVDVNDGQVVRLPIVPGRDYNVLFNGEIGEAQVVTGSVYLINHDFGKLSRRTSLLQAFAWFPFAQLILVFVVLPFLFYSGVANLFVNPPLAGSFVRAFGIGIGVFLLFTLFPFVGPLAIKALGRLDEDDYIGGFVLTVAPEGPDVEIVGFDLNGSDGIDVEGGERYSGTSGSVDYTVNIEIVRFD